MTRFAAAASALAVISLWLDMQAIFFGFQQGRPRVATSTRATKQTIVKSGEDLQSAINAAGRGDTIILDVAKFNTSTGFVLPAKPGSFNGSNYITIQTANLSSLPVGRVSPADTANMPSLIVTQRGTSVLTVNSGASGYQLIGLEIQNNLSGNTSSDITNTMVEIAYTANNIVFDRCVVHPKEHPTLANNWLTRGKFAFTVNGSYTTIQRSYVYDFFGRDPDASQSAKGSGQQTEDVYVSPTADHVTVDNNFLQAWYATMQTAGADGAPINPAQVLATPAPTLTSARLSHTSGLSPNMIIALDLPHIDDPTKCPLGGQGFDAPCYAVARVATVDTSTGDVTFSTPLVVKSAYGYRVPAYTLPTTGSRSSATWQGTQPSYITMTRNTLDIPLGFSDYHFSTNGNTGKGIIETKASLNFLFEGNIITGFPSTLAFTTTNQNCGAPWQTTANTIVRNNWFQAYRTGVLASFTDYGCVSTQGHDLIVDNNLFTGGVTTGDFLRLSGPAANITVTHNTAVGGFVTSDGSTYTGAPWVASNPSNGGCTLSAKGGGTACSGSQQYYPVDKATGVTIRDNLTDAGKYTAICYDSTGTGAAFLACFKNPTQDHNLFVLNVQGADPLHSFPGGTNRVASSWAAVRFVGNSPMRLSDWRLQPGSPAYKAASDGTDIGVNIDLLSQALFGNSSATTMPKSTRAPSL
jgi:hypothetical protein